MSFFGSPGVINALWILAGGFLMGFGWAAGGRLFAKITAPKG